MSRVIIGIDPSIRSAGVGILIEESYSLPWQLLASHTIKWRPSNADWLLRVQVTANDLCALVAPYIHKHGASVIIECPQIRLDSKGEHAMRSEGIQKLYQQVGCLVGRLTSMDCHVYGVRPQGWKGMLSKAIVKARLAKRLAEFLGDLQDWSDDAVEATAMAYWFGDAIKSDLKGPPPASILLPNNSCKLQEAAGLITTHVM